MRGFPNEEEGEEIIIAEDEDGDEAEEAKEVYQEMRVTTTKLSDRGWVYVDDGAPGKTSFYKNIKSGAISLATPVDDFQRPKWPDGSNACVYRGRCSKCCESESMQATGPHAMTAEQGRLAVAYLVCETCLHSIVKQALKEKSDKEAAQKQKELSNKSAGLSPPSSSSSRKSHHKSSKKLTGSGGGGSDGGADGKNKIKNTTASSTTTTTTSSSSISSNSTNATPTTNSKSVINSGNNNNNNSHNSSSGSKTKNEEQADRHHRQRRRDETTLPHHLGDLLLNSTVGKATPKCLYVDLSSFVGREGGSDDQTQQAAKAKMYAYKAGEFRRKLAKAAKMKIRCLAEFDLPVGDYLCWRDAQDRRTEYYGGIRDAKAFGLGLSELPQGNYYFGPHLNGQAHTDKINKEGTFVWADGTRYVGQMFRGMQHGRGRKTWADGTIYTGDFAMGKEHGEGRKEWPNKSEHTGRFRFGLRDGPGEYSDGKGNVTKGIFKDDPFEAEKAERLHHNAEEDDDGDNGDDGGGGGGGGDKEGGKGDDEGDDDDSDDDPRGKRGRKAAGKQQQTGKGGGGGGRRRGAKNTHQKKEEKRGGGGGTTTTGSGGGANGCDLWKQGDLQAESLVTLTVRKLAQIIDDAPQTYAMSLFMQKVPLHLRAAMVQALMDEARSLSDDFRDYLPELMWKLCPSLDLSTRVMGLDDLTKLTYLIEGNSQLTTLKLSRCSIREAGIKAVAGLVAKAARLGTVDVSWNLFGKDGAEIMLEAAGQSKALSSLSMSGCGLGPEGACYVGLALSSKDMGRLTALDISFNDIGGVGGKALSEAIKVNTTLKSLNLRMNGLGPRGGADIAQALLKNSGALKEINVVDNKVGVQVATQIAASVRGGAAHACRSFGHKTGSNPTATTATAATTTTATPFC